MCSRQSITIWPNCLAFSSIRSSARAGHPLDLHLLRAIVDYNLTYPDLYHHPLEDMIFTALRERAPDAAVGVVDLAAEHERLAAASRKLAAAIDLADATQASAEIVELTDAYRSAWLQHTTMEETVLFPAARDRLNADDWRDIEERAGSGTDPLFGPKVDAAFDVIHRQILDRAWSQR